MKKIGLVLADFSMNSSFHGINHIFGPRLFRFKIAWVLLSAISSCFWFYYMFGSLHEFYHVQPTLTETKIVHNDGLTIPTVLLCADLANISAVENIFPSGIGPLFTYLLLLSQNPMLEMFQTSLSQNISEAFRKFPNIERRWEILYKQQNVDPSVAAFYGKKKVGI